VHDSRSQDAAYAGKIPAVVKKAMDQCT